MTRSRRARKQGVRPGQLSVDMLEKVKDEALGFLNAGQWAYIDGVVRNRLPDFGNVAATRDLRLEKVGQRIWELKLKGNTLGKINVRVFFAHVPQQNRMVVLLIVKKENEDQTRPHVILKAENRLDYYLEKLA